MDDREAVAGQRAVGEDVEERVRVRAQTDGKLVGLGVPRGLAVVVVGSVLGVLARRGLLVRPVAAARVGPGRLLLGIALRRCLDFTH
jgi:hypothetical protein